MSPDKSDTERLLAELKALRAESAENTAMLRALMKAPAAREAFRNEIADGAVWADIETPDDAPTGQQPPTLRCKACGAGPGDECEDYSVDAPCGAHGVAKNEEEH